MLPSTLVQITECGAKNSRIGVTLNEEMSLKGMLPEKRYKGKCRKIVPCVAFAFVETLLSARRPR